MKDFPMVLEMIFFRYCFLIFFICFIGIGMVPVQAEEKIRVISEEFPPFNFSQNGDVKGLSTDIVKELLKRTGTEMEGEQIEMLPWKRGYHIALNDKNVLLYTTTRTPQREKLFKWVGPIFPREQWLYKHHSRNDIKIEKVGDLSGYKIVVTDGSANQQLISKAGVVEKDKLIKTSETAKKLKMMLSKRADLSPFNPIEIKIYLQNMGEHPGLLTKAFLLSKEYDYYLAFSLGTSDEVVHGFQQALDDLKRNGVYPKI